MEKDEATADSNFVANIGLTEFDGVPCAHDLEIAARLGFSQPRDIRALIKRNIKEIEQFGAARRRAALLTRPQGGTVEVQEYWLNEEQALLTAVLSDAPNAPAVRAMLIRVFVAWRRSNAEGTAFNFDAETRKIIGGILKSVVHREIGTVLPDMVRAHLASGMAIRNGRTAGEIWHEHNLPTIKNGPQWLANRLQEMGAAAENGACGQLGDVKARMFDHDKANACMRNGLRNRTERYISERRGQRTLHLVAQAKK